MSTALSAPTHGGRVVGEALAAEVRHRAPEPSGGLMDGVAFFEKEAPGLLHDVLGVFAGEAEAAHGEAVEDGAEIGVERVEIECLGAGVVVAEELADDAEQLVKFDRLVDDLARAEGAEL